jgi:hypothetical protein
MTKSAIVVLGWLAVGCLSACAQRATDAADSGSDQPTASARIEQAQAEADALYVTEQLKDLRRCRKDADANDQTRESDRDDDVATPTCAADQGPSEQ